MASGWTEVKDTDFWASLYPLADPFPLVQTWEWGEAKARVGGQPVRFSLGKCGVQLDRKRALLWGAGGPFGDTDRLSAELFQDLARELRLPILLAPHVPLSGAESLRASTYIRGTVVLAVDLSTDLVSLRSAANGKWRNSLSKAERSGLTIVNGSIDELFALLRHMAYRKGFRIPYSIDFVAALAGQEAANFRVRLAVSPVGPAAVWADATVGGTATYLMGATSEEGRTSNASYLLAWDAVLRARSLGAKFLDLGGVDPDSEEGTDRFKKRTGGQLLRFPGIYLFGQGPRCVLVRSALRLRRLLELG